MTEESAAWVANQPGFWGTIRQLTECAKCGGGGGGHHEPRNFADIFKPSVHWICDDCYETLPESGDD